MNVTVSGGQNKQHSAAKNVAKLDRETEELHHETVSHDVARLIQQGRQAKNMTQKELATVCTLQFLSTHLFISLFTGWRKKRGHPISLQIF